jgi:N-acetylglutamate synthase-like GNAT family acetyltransferase
MTARGDGIHLRRATLDDAEPLTDLGIRSKAHWGYDATFLAACREELTVSPRDIAADNVFVAERGAVVIGYYAVTAVLEGACELKALFVDPPAIATGVGKRLFEQATQQARALGAIRMIIESDPNAAGFYQAMGATRSGQRPSGSIQGRWLPVFELTL